MSGILQKIQSMATTVSIGSLGEGLDIEYRRKVVLLNFVCMIGFAILVPMAILAYWQGNSNLALFDLVMAVILLTNIIFLRRTGYYKIFIYISVGSAMIFYLYLFVSGGVNNTAFVWFYTFPLFSLFLLGLRDGTIATLFMLLCALVFFLIDPNTPKFAHYSFDLKLRFLPSFIAVFIFAYTFEFLRHKTQKELEASRDRLEKEKINAEKANRAKSDFLANMSHELRTPLNHIIGFTELIVDKKFGPLTETQDEYLNDVLTSSRHLLSLINDILDLSKVEAGKLSLYREKIDLEFLITSSLNMIKEKCLKHGIALHVDFQDEIRQDIYADEIKLKQIMYNLLSNAVKFTPDGGAIHVKVSLFTSKDIVSDKYHSRDHSFDMAPQAGAKFVQISVSDTGIGIEKKDIERIFKPFEQVENSASRKYPGTGLGLSLTKRLVELHGGTIWAESKGLGKGSKFIFRIPLSKPNMETDHC